MEKLQLSLAEITEISREHDLGDMCYLELESGYSNTLVGPQSRCLFLVHGKNVGSSSLYILASKNSTNYLCDLHLHQSKKIESKVLSIDHTGETKETIVKKIELKRMPYILLRARCKEIVGDSLGSYDPTNVSMFIQNHKESRLVNKNCSSISVDDLDIGSKVLVYTGLHGGRHFGMEVEGVGLIER